MNQSEIFTATDIAKEIGANVLDVRHILAARGHIQPVRRAGLVRLYGPSSCADVKNALAGIARRRRRASVTN